MPNCSNEVTSSMTGGLSTVYVTLSLKKLRCAQKLGVDKVNNTEKKSANKILVVAETFISSVLILKSIIYNVFR